MTAGTLTYGAGDDACPYKLTAAGREGDAFSFSAMNEGDWGCSDFAFTLRRKNDKVVYVSESGFEGTLTR